MGFLERVFKKKQKNNFIIVLVVFVFYRKPSEEKHFSHRYSIPSILLSY